MSIGERKRSSTQTNIQQAGILPPVRKHASCVNFDIRNVWGSASAPAPRASNKQAHCPLLGNTPLACISLRNVNLRQYTQSSQGRVGGRNLYPSSQQCNSRSCMCLGQCSLVQLYILTAGSRSALLPSLHRCRSHQRRSQEAGWKLMMAQVVVHRTFASAA